MVVIESSAGVKTVRKALIAKHESVANLTLPFSTCSKGMYEYTVPKALIANDESVANLTLPLSTCSEGMYTVPKALFANHESVANLRLPLMMVQVHCPLFSRIRAKLFEMYFNI